MACFDVLKSFFHVPLNANSKLLTAMLTPIGVFIVVCIYHLVMISIKWSETAQKNALASMDVIVTQLLCYHIPLLYFICNHLIYNVLAMGLTNANDIFEQCLCDILHGLDGVFNIADDILVSSEISGEFKDNVIRFLD